MNKDIKKKFTAALPAQFFRRIVLVQFLLTIVALISTAYLARYYLKKAIISQTEEQLHSSLRVIKDSIIAQRQTPISLCYSIRFDSSTRYSLIAWDGTVLCDTTYDYKEIENLSLKADVLSAKNSGKGSELIWQKTEKTLFGSIIIGDGEKPSERFILREAVSLDPIEKTLSAFDRVIITIMSPLLIILTLLSLWIALRFAFPLRSLIRKIQNIQNTFSKEEGSFIAPDDDWNLMEQTIDKVGQDLERYVDELFQENEKVKTLIESISDPILALNKNHQIIFASKAFKEKIIILYPEVEALFKKLFETGQIIMKPDLTLTNPDTGERFFCNLTLTPLRDYHKRIFGAVSVFHDIGHYKRTQQMREDFVANVSHEVRTPLTALKGYVQMLRYFDFGKEEKVADCLKRIENNTDRVMKLFQDVLNLSMIEAKTEIEKEFLSTQEITETVLENVKKNYPEKKMSIKIEYGLEEIYAGPMLFEQVLTNLIDNAFKYTPNEGMIDIQWYRKDQFSVFQIKDSGIGMAPEHLPRLFERFYRVDPSRSEIRGTGLGLAIVKHILQKHQGKINVVSRLKEGTTFTALIPYKIKTTKEV